MNEHKLREALVERGRSLYDRGYAHGSSGNLSARVDDGILVTPTGSSLGRLDPARIAKVDANGVHVTGDPPSKEAFLHLAMYAERASANAIVHLHCTCAVAISCLVHADPRNVLPPLTAYHVMRVGTLPLIPYHRPATARWPKRCGASRRSTGRCCSPTTGRSSRASRSTTRWTAPRSSSRRRSSRCCSASGRCRC